MVEGRDGWWFYSGYYWRSNLLHIEMCGNTRLVGDVQIVHQCARTIMRISFMFSLLFLKVYVYVYLVV